MELSLKIQNIPSVQNSGANQEQASSTTGANWLIGSSCGESVESERIKLIKLKAIADEKHCKAAPCKTNGSKLQKQELVSTLCACVDTNLYPRGSSVFLGGLSLSISCSSYWSQRQDLWMKTPGPQQLKIRYQTGKTPGPDNNKISSQTIEKSSPLSPCASTLPLYKHIAEMEKLCVPNLMRFWSKGWLPTLMCIWTLVLAHDDSVCTDYSPVSVLTKSLKFGKL